MQKNNLIRNIILAFVFFFVGRFIVFQMGDVGVWIVFGLVGISYVAWWYFRRSGRDRK